MFNWFALFSLLLRTWMTFLPSSLKTYIRAWWLQMQRKELLSLLFLLQTKTHQWVWKTHFPTLKNRFKISSIYHTGSQISKLVKRVDSICFFNKGSGDKSLASFLPPCCMLLSEHQPISAVAFDMMHFKDVFKMLLLSLGLQCCVCLL